MNQVVNIYQVMTDSPYLTAWVALAVITAVRLIYQSTLKFLLIMGRGYPPPHVDANGEFKPLPKPVKQDKK